MLKTYLMENYGYSEPIFLNDLSIEGLSENAVRQSVKRLVASGFLERYDNGIYYIPKHGGLLGTLSDKVKGLDLGADDYLVKPFAFEELMARIRCVTRRSPILTPSDPSKVCLEDLTLFIEEKRLMGPAGQCTLSQREAVLTEVLLRAGLNTPMPRTTLLLKVWGPDNDIEDGNLDNYIHFLRRRFRQLESTLQIKTLRGTGYCLTTADERN